MPVSGWNSSQPVSLARKSKCHQERRNSPSVASLNPTEACRCTTFSISVSSILRSSSGAISPFSSFARASLILGGRRRLPTSSARKGGLVRCMVLNSGNSSVAGAAGKLIAVIVAPLLQARKHLVDLVHGPGPRLRHRRHVLFNGERAEDVALLRYPADPGARPLVGPQCRDVGSAEAEHAAEAAGD